MFAMVSIIGWVFVALSRMVEPVAAVVVSNDPTIEFTAASALQLTKSAMRDANLSPTAPVRISDISDGDEQFIDRNAVKSNESAIVIWRIVPNESKYRVVLERGRTQVTASIYRNY
jgi:hypothetical protein